MSETGPTPEIVTGMRCPICHQESLVVRTKALNEDEPTNPSGRHPAERGEHWLDCNTDGCAYVYDLKTKVNVN
jgi:hypothetical protein